MTPTTQKDIPQEQHVLRIMFLESASFRVQDTRYCSRLRVLEPTRRIYAGVRIAWISAVARAMCIGLPTEASNSSPSYMYCPNLGQLRHRFCIDGHVASGGMVLPADVRCAQASSYRVIAFPTAGRRGERPSRRCRWEWDCQVMTLRTRLPYGSSRFWLLCSAS